VLDSLYIAITLFVLLLHCFFLQKQYATHSTARKNIFYYNLVQVKVSKFEAITTSSCGVLFGQCQNGFFGKNICRTSNIIHFLVSNMRQVYTRRTSASDFFISPFMSLTGLSLEMYIFHFEAISLSTHISGSK
jgi:hypothetical protein